MQIRDKNIYVSPYLIRKERKLKVGKDNYKLIDLFSEQKSLLNFNMTKGELIMFDRIKNS